MTSGAPSPEIDLSWQMREGEARLLAELMRTSRLTVLYGETGPGRTALLTGGVVPLLRRRETDTAGKTPREARVVIPFPDRRTRQSGRLPSRMAELVVFFDTWSDEPSSDLRRCILEASPTRAAADATCGIGLADMLESLGKRQDLQFLIVLDRFEELVAQDATVNGRFIDEFCEAVNRVGLCANFLLSLSEAAKPRLDGLRRQIQGFDDFSVRLLRWNSVVDQTPISDGLAAAVDLRTASERAAHVANTAVATPLHAEPKVASPVADRPRVPRDKAAARAHAKTIRAAALPHVPIETSAVYAFIESILTQTAKSGRSDTWQNAATGDAPEPSAPGGSKVTDGRSRNFDDPGHAGNQASAREKPLGVVIASKLRRPTHGHDDAAGTSAPFANSLHSALRWLERQIRPKR